MNSKVLIPKCIRCKSKALRGSYKKKKTTMQIENRLPPSTQKEVFYRICDNCVSAHGTIVRIWRRPNEKDLGYFSKERIDGVELASDCILED